MSIYMSRLFPKSNSSLLLCKGTAIKSSVLRLRGEDTFVLDTGIGTPRICLQDQLTRVPTSPSATRFENNVQLVQQTSRESLIKRKILERFFVDLVAGDAVIKERAASKFNDLVGSSDVVKAGEPHILLPRRFRQKLAWAELTQIWQRNASVKGFILDKVRGGYAVAIAGFVTFMPFRRTMARSKSNDRYTVERINNKTMNVVVL